MPNLGFLGLSLFVTSLFTSACVTASAAGKYEPLPVPDNLRIMSSQPREIVWSTLSKKEKSLATHLVAAANAGKTILLFQIHRHGLLIKTMLQTSLNEKNIQKTEELLGAGFAEYLTYAAKFEDFQGPYTASNRKYVLSKVSPELAQELFKRYSPKADTKAVQESVQLMTDRSYETIFKPENTEGVDLENSGNNIYEHGLTGKEVSGAFNSGLKSNVNCRIARNSEGKLHCEVQALSNPSLHPQVRKALTQVVSHLERALKYASTKHQENQIRYLVRHLKTGSIEDFRQMNIEWVKDGTSSKVDFMMGFVESFFIDYQNQIGAWEAYVQIMDPKVSMISKTLSTKAQELEDKMPYGQYKKVFPRGYAPPALMVYYFQEVASPRSGGYNLPNYDDIRRDVGAKNIIRLDMPGLENDEVGKRILREMYAEFLPADKVEEAMTYYASTKRTMTLLHEITGHGSGTYNKEKYGPQEDPISVLGALGASLEEQRADLTGLLFGADQILVQAGVFKDQEEALRAQKAYYNIYLANFLRDVSRVRGLIGAHHRGHWLLINHLLEAGAIEKVSKDGSALTDENLVLVVKDHDLYRKVCVDVLAKLQRIKAEREVDELKALYAKYAPLEAIKESWLQTVIRRGEKLAINAGSFDQPWVLKDGGVQVLGEATLKGVASHLGK